MTFRLASTGAGRNRSARAAALPFAFTTLAASFAALAQSPSDVPSLNETVVTAQRVRQRLSDAVADISVIDRETIDRSGAESVADVLAKVPGIQIARTGGVGNTSSVYVRGAETRFTAVFIDGVRVDSQSTGGATWEAIPLSQIDRIEIVRGPGAAVYGSDAIGGVIQLFTRKGEGGFAPFVGVGVGSRSLYKAEAGASGAGGGFDYSFGVAHEQSKGFNVRTDPGFNPDNDDYDTTSGNVRLGYQFNPQQRIEATALSNYMNSGYDDFIFDPTAAPVDDRNKYWLRSAGLNWTSQWTDVWRTKFAITDSSSRYQSEPNFFETKTELRGYLFQNEFRFGPHLVTADLERREDKLNNAANLAFGSPEIDRDRSQNALALGYGFTQGPHTLQLNARHDDDSEFGGHDTGSIAYGFAFTPQWRVTASAGTAFRAPTLYQRFSEFGVAGLQPEEGTNYEVGLRWGEGASSASVTAYHNKVRNLINFDASATGCLSFFGCYTNTGTALYEGVTLAATHRIGSVALRASFDWQDPRDLDTDKILVQRARQYGTFGVDWTVGTWLLGAEVIASGQRYANAANTQTLAGYGLLNLNASTPLGKGFTLLARIDNVSDKQYQLVQNYATPGRTFYVGVKWSPKPSSL
ncbi:TonB-dependent receptor [Variovorax sp. J22R133]|uniref:TonB-dependent receptor domain-containing protein n=1 Tax=Variovorax brevis TaxID=3053503 RepID=UPI0025758B23|nr:TonB-dependent receptor [Variovorax sp. J22R133]MDM0112536.1 TonB-dependent receptor [Variovorax sp. J22R133]